MDPPEPADPGRLRCREQMPGPRGLVWGGELLKAFHRWGLPEYPGQWGEECLL